MGLVVVPEGVAEQMAQRADAAECGREWIGLFEFVVWGVMQSSAVHVLFGSHVVDIMAVFAPQFAVPAPLFVTRAAGVLLRNTKWRAANTIGGNFPKINHFVWAVPIKGCDVHVSSGLYAEQTPRAANCAISAGVEAGWFLKPTVAQGDCGIDVMAASANLERSPASWQHIRIRAHYWLRQAISREHPFLRTLPVSPPDLPG